MEYVLDRELQEMVLSNIPGKETKYVCLYGAYTMCSYTSSVITYVSYFTARLAIYSNSSFEKTFPQGLLGLHKIKAFGFCLNAFSNSSLSKLNTGGCKGT